MICEYLQRVLDSKDSTIFNLNEFPLQTITSISVSPLFSEEQRSAALGALSIYSLFSHSSLDFLITENFLLTLKSYVSESFTTDLIESSFNLIGIMQYLSCEYRKTFNYTFLYTLLLHNKSQKKSFIFALQSSLLFHSENNISNVDSLIQSLVQNHLDVVFNSFKTIVYCSDRTGSLNLIILFKQLSLIYGSISNEAQMVIVYNLLTRFKELPDEYPDVLLFLLKSNPNPKIRFYVYKLLIKFHSLFKPRMTIDLLFVLHEVLEKEPSTNAIPLSIPISLSVPI